MQKYYSSLFPLIKTCLLYTSMIIKKLYFDPFMDMFNGEILSFGISQKPSAESIMSALDEAITITNDCSYRRTFHSEIFCFLSAFVNMLSSDKPTLCQSDKSCDMNSD